MLQPVRRTARPGGHWRARGRRPRAVVMIEVVVMMGLILVLTTGYTTLNIKSMQVQRANMVRDSAVHTSRAVAEKAAAVPWSVLVGCTMQGTPTSYNGFQLVQFADGSCPGGVPSYNQQTDVDGISFSHRVYVLWPSGVSGATSPTAPGMKRVVVVTSWKQPTPGLPTKQISTTIVRSSDPGEANLSTTSEVP